MPLEDGSITVKRDKAWHAIPSEEQAEQAVEPMEEWLDARIR